MEYAVIRTNGKQYKVSEGDLLVLDKISEPNKNIIFDEVLLVVNDSGSLVGKPTITGARVAATYIEDKKGKKIRVSKFRAKSRYRRTIGFRAQQSVVKIGKIDSGSGKVSKETEKSTKSAPKSKNK